MKLHQFLPVALVALCFVVSACSDDDGIPADPQGTVALNMSDEANGKTMLGDSGIYIDKGQNFVAGSDCLLFVIGKAGGLGAVRADELRTSAAQAAVQSGWGYVAVRPGALIQFPSGALAMPIGSSLLNYLKFYVVASLKEDDKTVGASVKYVLARPEGYGLPEYDTTALTIDLHDYDPDTDRGLTLTLPDADFEYDLRDPNGDLECRKQGRKLIFRVNGFVSESYTLFLRIRESYTRVNVRVEA